MPTLDESKTLLFSLLTSGLASAAVVFLARNWISERLKNAIKHEYDAKLETHKAQLTSENAITLEKLKSQLQASALERQVQFSAVYARREELLGRLHKALNETLEACWQASRPGTNEVTNETKDQFAQMHLLMDEAALYFPEAFCTRWHSDANELYRTLVLFLSARETRTPNWEKDLAESRRSFEAHLAAFNAVRGELRNEVRKWLGTAS